MVRLIYDPWQLQFMATKGDKILCTGRQVGKSETCGKDAGDFAIENPKTKPIVMIAPVERQSKGLFRKTLNYLTEYFPKMIAKGKKAPTQSLITLTTGVEIYCLPVGLNGLGVRFLTIGRLYVDEASRVPQEVWDAIEPALLTTGGDTILLSTPFGRQGEFYRTWCNENGAYDSFTKFSIDSLTVVKERKICETWTEEQRDKAVLRIERAKKRKSESVFSQEYMGEFVSGLRQFFKDGWIKSVMKLKNFRMPSPIEEEYIGQDVARMGGDKGTFVGVSRNKWNKYLVKQTYQKIIQYELSTTTFDITLQINKQRNPRKFYIDTGAGGGGATLYDFLMRVNEIKRKLVSINNASASLSRKTNEKKRILKEDLYENVLWLGESGYLELVESQEMLDSLRSVQYEYTDNGIHIFGDDTHLVEGLIRACYCTMDKTLNSYII